MTIINTDFLDGGKQIKIKKNIELDENKNTNNYDFFSSGSYGCTMYPKMKCDGLKSKQKKPNYMSKLSIEGFYSNNEYEIGQKLMKLKQNNLHDSIINHINFVEKKCSIKRKKININTNKYDCSILESDKYNHKEDFVLFQLQYIPSKEISKYLNANFNIKLLLRYYFFILKCIQFLSKHNIIHHDLHMSNVIVDKKKEFHLIDFGIAIDYNNCFKNQELNMNYIKNILITFDPAWEYWSIEYHILCYFVFKKTELTKKELQKIINTYYHKNKIFNHFFKNMKNYKKIVLDFYSEKFVNKTSINKHIKEILENSHKTWDIYQVNYVLLVLIRYYDIKNIENIINLCKIGIHYDYTKRHNVDFFINTIISILTNNRKMEHSIYDSDNIQKEPSKEDLQTITLSKKTFLNSV